MKEKTAIMTDVNAGLDYIPDDMGIGVIRSIINFGDEHFVDGVEIHANEFYRRIQEEDIIPSTSAPTVGETMEMIEGYIKQGYTDVIMFPISYKLSSIGSMVENLQQEYEGRINIHVFDTKTACYLQAYYALTAQKMANAGASVAEILEYAKYLQANTHSYFIVDNLKYLVKNGRLSGISGFLGGLLKIKPVLELNKEGLIVPFEKIKTHQKAVERAIDLMMDEIKDAKKVAIFVFHTVREHDAKLIAKYFEEHVKAEKTIEIHMVTPAVGAHIGYGILGMGYFILEKQDKLRRNYVS